MNGFGQGLQLLISYMETVKEANKAVVIGIDKVEQILREMNDKMMNILSESKDIKSTEIELKNYVQLFHEDDMREMKNVIGLINVIDQNLRLSISHMEAIKEANIQKTDEIVGVMCQELGYVKEGIENTSAKGA